MAATTETKRKLFRQAAMNHAIHNHLRLHSGVTAEAMWVGLCCFRRLGIAYEDLPATEAELTAGLERLVVAGLAEYRGKLVLWLPVRREAEAAKVERRLFA